MFVYQDGWAKDAAWKKSSSLKSNIIFKEFGK